MAGLMNNSAAVMAVRISRGAHTVERLVEDVHQRADLAGDAADDFAAVAADVHLIRLIQRAAISLAS